MAFDPSLRGEEVGGLELQIALMELMKKRKSFWLTKRAGKGRNQIGSQEIQMYASFLVQNEGLQESENTHGRSS